MAEIMPYGSGCRRDVKHGATVHGATYFSRLRHSVETRITPDPVLLTPPMHCPPSAAAESQAEGVCYVCLCDEGEMLVNVCACRWSRVHAACLERLLLNSTDGNCGVCKKRIQHEPPASPLALMWKQQPQACFLRVISSICVATVGLFGLCLAPALHGAGDTLCMLLGALLAVHAGVTLHSLLGQGTEVLPTAPTCRQVCKELAGAVCRLVHCMIKAAGMLAAEADSRYRAILRVPQHARRALGSVAPEGGARRRTTVDEPTVATVEATAEGNLP